MFEQVPNANSPAVSVIMPVYNAARFLHQAIESVLAQTYDNFEFLIIDDGSTDETSDILERYAAQDRRIRLLQNNENLGVTLSLNKGIQAARGVYVARMDADDLSLPDRLERQVAFLEANGHIGIIGANIVRIDESGGERNRPALPSSPVVLRWHLYFSNYLAHSSVMIRRTIFDEIGLYAENVPVAQDFDLWIRASAVTQLANLETPLIRYRVWSENVSAKHGHEQARTVTRLCRNQWCSLLREDIPVALVDRYFGVGRQAISAEDSLALGQIIGRLYHCHLAKYPHLREDRRQVARDAARRIYRLARAALRDSPLTAIRLTIAAFTINPTAAAGYGWRAVRLDLRRLFT